MNAPEWKPIQLAPDYEVSNFGEVRSLGFITPFGSAKKYHCPKILKPWISAGYPTVGLRTNDGPLRIRVHRLVAEAFLDNPSGKLHVNHKDGNRTNNNIDNLEWTTASENAFHKTRILKKGLGEDNGHSKLTDVEVIAIRAASGMQKDIAVAFGVCQMTVSLIKRYKIWKHVA
jgi:hypothetical protein